MYKNAEQNTLILILWQEEKIKVTLTDVDGDSVTKTAKLANATMGIVTEMTSTF